MNNNNGQNGQNEQRQNLLYLALASKYEAEMKEALATLSIYFDNPVGIGEHPQHLEEMDKFVEQLAAAEDKLQNLKRYFAQNGKVKDNVLMYMGE